jgi:hypothetical protein
MLEDYPNAISTAKLAINTNPKYTMAYNQLIEIYKKIPHS